MPLDNAPDICQTNSRAFEVIWWMQALKNSKEFMNIIHIKTHAVVTDKDHGLGSIFAPNLNLRNLSGTREFQSVRDQIGHHDPQHGSITGDYG